SLPRFRGGFVSPFFLSDSDLSTLTKPRGQPLRTEEPTKPARSNQPARATKRRSPINCPPRLAQTELADELPMSARTTPRTGKPTFELWCESCLIEPSSRAEMVGWRG